MDHRLPDSLGSCDLGHFDGHERYGIDGKLWWEFKVWSKKDVEQKVGKEKQALQAKLDRVIGAVPHLGLAGVGLLAAKCGTRTTMRPMVYSKSLEEWFPVPVSEGPKMVLDQALAGTKPFFVGGRRVCMLAESLRVLSRSGKIANKRASTFNQSSAANRRSVVRGCSKRAFSTERLRGL